jgi:4-hydroxybutyrate CoA-transferase
MSKLSHRSRSIPWMVVILAALALASDPARAGQPGGQINGGHRQVDPRLRRSATKPARPATVSADEAVKLIRSGQRVLLPAEVGASQVLVDALVKRANGLHGKRPVEVLHTASLLPQPSHASADPSKLQVNALFINGSLRQYLGHLKITPAYLSEIPKLVSGPLKPDVVFIRVSPPDARGYVSMGPNADVVVGLLADPKVKVIAEVNPNVPRTRGASRLHVSHIDRLVQGGDAIPEMRFDAKDPVADAIGRNVAAQVPNGATLQFGIGELQESVASALVVRGKQESKLRVKVWTEIASNGIKALAEAGLIAKSRDAIQLGFALGDRGFYEFLGKDKRVKLLPTATINDPMLAGARRKLVAVNSGLALDLYGQACSEMVPRAGADGKIVPIPYSGVGGQVDFFRAVQRSPGGRGFLTLRSTAKNGTLSTITLDLPQGLVVTTNRYDMDRVATEWGVAELKGKDVVARAQALIRIAHPSFRAELARQGQERFGGAAASWQAAARVTPEEQQLAANLK